jgi:hypothetical protein
MWRQAELYDGTYDFTDLCEAHRVLDWRMEVEVEEEIRRRRED